ncbi:hypothetical protein [Antrihabitans sp. YC2-6]|uniref:hypothetical protein n=1 Tax=Antrihabitans sp. YC2-6 TaxID=2799498 RepID=UPI0018F7B859|nr:hypothetical protein [Antrihabitans sp. YC2-6]MBJ8344559.1 hypothetical protein [Antrihabitans sp. YC2-6]
MSKRLSLAAVIVGAGAMLAACGTTVEGEPAAEGMDLPILSLDDFPAGFELDASDGDSADVSTDPASCEDIPSADDARTAPRNEIDVENDDENVNMAFTVVDLAGVDYGVSEIEDELETCSSAAVTGDLEGDLRYRPFEFEIDGVESASRVQLLEVTASGQKVYSVGLVIFAKVGDYGVSAALTEFKPGTIPAGRKSGNDVEYRDEFLALVEEQVKRVEALQ